MEIEDAKKTVIDRARALAIKWWDYCQGIQDNIPEQEIYDLAYAVGNLQDIEGKHKEEYKGIWNE